MKKIISPFLSIFSTLAAVPTGWAIFAGVTEKPAFPMNPIAAGIGALAIIATSISAGSLISEIGAFNQGMKNKTERETLEMLAIPAWLIFFGCVLAEITLSLLIVVIPGALVFGVLVFPLMTAAGVFSFAVRTDLQKRDAEREQLRAQSKRTAGTSAKGAKGAAESIAHPSRTPKSAKGAVQSAPDMQQCKVPGCGISYKWPHGKGAHYKKHHPDLVTVKGIPAGVSLPLIQQKAESK